MTYMTKSVSLKSEWLLIFEKDRRLSDRNVVVILCFFNNCRDTYVYSMMCNFNKTLNLQYLVIFSKIKFRLLFSEHRIFYRFGNKFYLFILYDV